MKKVLCINDKESGNMLIEGKEYTVIAEKEMGDYIPLYLVRYSFDNEEWFSSTRFREIEKNEELEDLVNNPNHYKGNKGIETIDFIENVLTREEFIGYLRGNIIKYQSRANLKGRKEEDLKKAKWYSDKLVEVLKNE